MVLVERRGFEPLTPTLPVLCAPNCANAPIFGCIYFTIALLSCQVLLIVFEKNSTGGGNQRGCVGVKINQR